MCSLRRPLFEYGRAREPGANGFRLKGCRFSQESALVHRTEQGSSCRNVGKRSESQGEAFGSAAVIAESSERQRFSDLEFAWNRRADFSCILHKIGKGIGKSSNQAKAACQFRALRITRCELSGRYRPITWIHGALN